MASKCETAAEYVIASGTSDIQITIKITYVDFFWKKFYTVGSHFCLAPYLLFDSKGSALSLIK